LQLIVDGLNQDYKSNYSKEFAENKYRIYIDSPLGTDRDAEIKDVTVRQTSFDLFTKLVDAGYDHAAAAKYAAGESTLEELGKPTNEPKPVVTPAVPAQEPAEPQNTQQAYQPAVRNAMDDASTTAIQSQEGALRNAIINIEERLVMAVSLKALNAYESQSDIISSKDRKEQEEALGLALANFYFVVTPLLASSVMNRRTAEFARLGEYAMDAVTRKNIAEAAERAGTSHVNTVLEDLPKTIQKAEVVNADPKPITDAVQKKYEAETVEGIRKTIDRAKAASATTKELAAKLTAAYEDVAEAEMLAAVGKAALEGLTQPKLVAMLRNEYVHITTERAKVIARTETNRAFSQAQYDTDRQFLEQNDLTSQAYKKWVCNGPNPCPYCVIVGEVRQEEALDLVNGSECISGVILLVVAASMLLDAYSRAYSRVLTVSGRRQLAAVHRGAIRRSARRDHRWFDCRETRGSLRGARRGAAATLFGPQPCWPEKSAPRFPSVRVRATSRETFR
jgi:hypothetical protein